MKLVSSAILDNEGYPPVVMMVELRADVKDTRHMDRKTNQKRQVCFPSLSTGFSYGGVLPEALPGEVAEEADDACGSIWCFCLSLTTAMVAVDDSLIMVLWVSLASTIEGQESRNEVLAIVVSRVKLKKGGFGV